MDKLRDNLPKCIPQHLVVWVYAEIKDLKEKQIRLNQSLYFYGNRNVETIFSA